MLLDSAGTGSKGGSASGRGGKPKRKKLGIKSRRFTNHRKFSWETSELRPVGKGNRRDVMSSRSEVKEMSCQSDGKSK